MLFQKKVILLMSVVMAAHSLFTNAAVSNGVRGNRFARKKGKKSKG
jgi:hypothetical protein